MTTFTSYIITATSGDGTVFYFMDVDDTYISADPAEGQIIANHADARRIAIGWTELQDDGVLEGYVIGYAEVEMKVML